MTDILSAERLAVLEKLAKCATHGPYTVEADDNGGGEYFAIHGEGYDWVANTDGLANSRYLQALDPATILAMIAHIRATQPQPVVTTDALKATPTDDEVAEIEKRQDALPMIYWKQANIDVETVLRKLRSQTEVKAVDREALSDKLRNWFPHYRNCMELIRDATTDISSGLASRAVPTLTEPRKRDKDETLLTHQIRCYAEYVRTEDSHGSRRSEIANILSAHASYISEYVDRITSGAPPSEPTRKEGE